MKLRRIIFKFTVWLAVVAAPIIWLTSTTSGLKTGLAIASIFSPVQFYYDNVSGKLLGQPITIQNLTVIDKDKKLTFGHVTFDWQLGTLNATKVTGLEQFLPHAELIQYQNITLDHIYAHIIRENKNYIINVQTNGIALQTNLVGNIKLLKTPDSIDVRHAFLKIGKNNIDLQQFKTDKFKLRLNLVEPQVIFKHSNGSIIANAEIHNSNDNPTMHASVQAKTFSLNDYQVNNVQVHVDMVFKPSVPLIANISADKVILVKQELKDLHIKLAGDIDKHTITSNAIYNNESLVLKAEANLQNRVWTAHKLLCGYKNEQLSGKAYYDFRAHTGNASLQGKLFAFATEMELNIPNPNNLSFNLHMHENSHNNLHAAFNMQQQKLSGNVNVAADDLAFLMKWMPDVTRLKGKFLAKVNIDGTLAKPVITSTTHLTDVTATIPVLGVKIKPLEVHVVGDKYGRYTVNGFGKMRRGPGELTLTGYIEPFKEGLPNAFTIVGTNVEFVNNQTAHLVASNKLNLFYAAKENRLDVSGDIEIHKGTITIADKRNQTIKSKDVVFVNEAPKKISKFITINPNIHLRIEEGVHFKGFDLDAKVSGKLNISRRHDASYADGRITIKEGTYQIPGQKLLINHGRLLYPPGTLLVNPVLDIKMIGKSPGVVSQKNGSPYLELVVQGTAQRPQISESGLSNDKDKAISQALLTGSGVISNNLLHDKLKISEIGITSNQDSEIEFFDDPKDKASLKNKDLVIGRSLGRKVYLQYLHNLGEANNRLRLKYALNQVWAIGLEGGTQGGGADLSFNIERD